MTQTLETLPLSSELLSYYRSSITALLNEYPTLLTQIENCRIQTDLSHKQAWDLHARSKEVVLLQKKLSASNQALFEERKHLLKVIAVQELKDRKKIRYLLSTTELPESEITYLKDQLSKKVVKVSVSKNKEKNKISTFSDKDLIILEDEVEATKLLLYASKTQQEEQRILFDQTLSSLKSDFAIKEEEFRIRFEHDDGKIEGLLKQVERLRSLCRENTRELLQMKKDFRKREMDLMEEKYRSLEDITNLKQSLSKQLDRVENAEKTIEIKVTKKQETLVNDLRHQLGKLEEETNSLKIKLAEMDQSHKKKTASLIQRASQVSASYISLRKRRDYEIEGFINDIIQLKKQIKSLEKAILKYGPLEDGELMLLDIARKTSLKADKISTTLSGLKGKVYKLEDELASLEI